MSMDKLFGKKTPWGRKVSNGDDLSALFSQGKDQICVTAEVRNEWLLGHRTTEVGGVKQVVQFDPLGGDLWVASLFVKAKAPTAPATPATGK